MQFKKLNESNGYKRLTPLAETICAETNHLKYLLNEENRFENCSCRVPGFFYDYSRQRVNSETMHALYDLAEETKVKDTFQSMVSGDKVNTTENRAALHTATRQDAETAFPLKDESICSAIHQVNEEIRTFSNDILNTRLTGSTGKPFKDAVIVGIGGSYLGCQFVYTALKTAIEPIINLHFLSNVDIDNFGEIIKKIEPETCLWIIVSKSYTTTETMANLKQVEGFLNRSHIDPAGHLVTITAKGSPGEASDAARLASFNMFDFIGGRYSVTSAVGVLPLTLAFGYDRVLRFLDGCRQMDRHALVAPIEDNIPLTAALIGIWNSNFLMYPAQAVIPYCSALSKLAPHVQQLYMESLGKGVTAGGKDIDYPSGVIIFGEPGTNAQHSFFQLAHQGAAFPIEFIGVINPVYKGKQLISKGVDNHQELWANMIAQAQALAVGKQSEERARYFTGNRPSSTILINEISPESIGMLLSFYEARTVYEGFILGVNPFDQFGVELGKVLASDIRGYIAEKNSDMSAQINTKNPITDFYLKTLFNKTL